MKSPIAERVASLDPVATRYVLALGAGARLVAVDARSARLPGLDALPVTTLAEVSAHAPDLVLLGASSSAEAEPVARLRAAGAAVREVAPQSLEEVLVLHRSLGARLLGAERADVLADRLGRALGAVAAESRGRARAQVAAVLSLDPFQPAPAHGFETDLLELAGATSLSHRHEPDALPSRLGELVAQAPDLVLLVSDAPLDERERADARRALAGALPLAFFALDRDDFWLGDVADTVRRLRAEIASATSAGRAAGPDQSP